MAHHHYFVQYHLYTVALHRYLRWRLGAAYRYDEHLGGVLYLFLRGMDGPDTPLTTDARADLHGARPHGVFFDRPARAVIERLSDLLAPGELAGGSGGHIGGDTDRDRGDHEAA